MWVGYGSATSSAKDQDLIEDLGVKDKQIVVYTKARFLAARKRAQHGMMEHPFM
jgi:hypothetical protein